jgi:hypothetical protein
MIQATPYPLDIFGQIAQAASTAYPLLTDFLKLRMSQEQTQWERQFAEKQLRSQIQERMLQLALPWLQNPALDPAVGARIVAAIEKGDPSELVSILQASPEPGAPPQGGGGAVTQPPGQPSQIPVTGVSRAYGEGEYPFALWPGVSGAPQPPPQPPVTGISGAYSEGGYAPSLWPAPGTRVPSATTPGGAPPAPAPPSAPSAQLPAQPSPTLAPERIGFYRTNAAVLHEQLRGARLSDQEIAEVEQDLIARGAPLQEPFKPETYEKILADLPVVLSVRQFHQQGIHTVYDYIVRTGVSLPDEAKPIVENLKLLPIEEYIDPKTHTVQIDKAIIAASNVAQGILKPTETASNIAYTQAGIAERTGRVRQQKIDEMAETLAGRMLRTGINPHALSERQYNQLIKGSGLDQNTFDEVLSRATEIYDKRHRNSVRLPNGQTVYLSDAETANTINRMVELQIQNERLAVEKYNAYLHSISVGIQQQRLQLESDRFRYQLAMDDLTAVPVKTSKGVVRIPYKKAVEGVMSGNIPLGALPENVQTTISLLDSNLRKAGESLVGLWEGLNRAQDKNAFMTSHREDMSRAYGNWQAIFDSSRFFTKSGQTVIGKTVREAAERIYADYASKVTNDQQGAIDLTIEKLKENGFVLGDGGAGLDYALRMAVSLGILPKAKIAPNPPGQPAWKPR